MRRYIHKPAEGEDRHYVRQSGNYGRENSKLYLKENTDTALEIENMIRGKHNLSLIEIEAPVIEAEAAAHS